MAVLFILSSSVGFAIVQSLFAETTGGGAGAGALNRFLEMLVKMVRELGITPYDPLSIIKIFLKNLLAAAVSIATGVLVLPPFLIIMLNGFVVGVVLGVTTVRGVGFLAALSMILPHGVFEIPALLLAAAVGVRLGADLWFRILGRGERVYYTNLNRFLGHLVVVALLLFVAAVVEVYVTPAVAHYTVSIGL